MSEFNLKPVMSKQGNEYIIFSMPREMPSDKVSSFEKEIINIIQKDSNFIIIDFSNMSYICSRGVGIIAYALGKVRKKNGDIKLLNLTPFVKNFLKLFNLIRYSRYMII